MEDKIKKIGYKKVKKKKIETSKNTPSMIAKPNITLSTLILFGTCESCGIEVTSQVYNDNNNIYGVRITHVDEEKPLEQRTEHIVDIIKIS